MTSSLLETRLNGYSLPAILWYCKLIVDEKMDKYEEDKVKKDVDNVDEKQSWTAVKSRPTCGASFQEM